MTDSTMLRDNYPSYVGVPPFEYRFATDNPRVGLWPRHGRLVNAEPEMRCEDFIDSGIYYKHLSQNDSPDKDHQPLIIDLVDINDPTHLLNREMYDLEIHIRSGKVNQAKGIK